MGLELSGRVISGFHTEGNHAVEFLNLFLETLIVFWASTGSRQSVVSMISSERLLQWSLKSSPVATYPGSSLRVCSGPTNPQLYAMSWRTEDELLSTVKEPPETSHGLRGAKFNPPTGLLYAPSSGHAFIYRYRLPKAWAEFDRFVLEECSLCPRENLAWGYSVWRIASGPWTGCNLSIVSMRWRTYSQE